ncbi:hypothetical protein HYU23_03975 [Candidatus Woesearchaeota archaeon]|nr:hypothetical protein [Candidatus Woesearchaeota archaeon]
MISKTVNGWPERLESATRELTNYPRSINYANRLFGLGLELFKVNSLYVPILPCEEDLRYVLDGSRQLHLRFDRFSLFSTEKMKVLIYMPEGNMGLEILMMMGAERKRDICQGRINMWGYDGFIDYFRALFQMAPAVTRIFEFNERGNKTGHTSYDLIFDLNTHTNLSY